MMVDASDFSRPPTKPVAKMKIGQDDGEEEDIRKRSKSRTLSECYISSANEMPLDSQPEFIQKIINFENGKVDNLEMDKYIKENVKKHGNDENVKKWTGLHYLCQAKNCTPQLLDTYFQHCFDAEKFDVMKFTTPLHLLCRNENVTKEHLDKYMDASYIRKYIQPTHDKRAHTPIHKNSI